MKNRIKELYHSFRRDILLNFREWVWQNFHKRGADAKGDESKGEPSLLLQGVGETVSIGRKTFTIGGAVWANGNSDYHGLFGHVTEIRDGAEKETDNEGPDIYCNFDIPDTDHRIAEIEKRFSNLYREPKKIDDLALDCVVMAPEMLEPIAEVLPESSGILCVLLCSYEILGEKSLNVLAVSSDHAILMRKMFDDLDEFESRKEFSATLTYASRQNNSECYCFESAAAEQSFFTREYTILEVPVYPISKGGATA